VDRKSLTRWNAIAFARTGFAVKKCPPKSVLEELVGLLRLEKTGPGRFRGQSQDLGFGNLFGGQVLGQALSAAAASVPADRRRAHSLHAYFLRRGDAARPIDYAVDCIRDGHSFTTRRIVASQEGRAIFNMSVSFQVPESGLEHQDPAPKVPGPEGIASQREIALRASSRLPREVRTRFFCRHPIEVRPINPMQPESLQKREPLRFTWLKARGRLPDDETLHQCLLAYASDFGLVSTALYPHGRSFWDPQMQVASLDHAMWFHRDFRMDDWLLYTMRSPSASGARGLNSGQIFTRDGKLVASVVQEGLIRCRA